MLQLFASVTVTTYVPAARPVAVAPVCTGDVFHEYVYNPVPPLTVAVAVPVAPPLQDTFVWLGVIASTAGWVIVTLVVPVHPLASFAVIVYVPGARPVKLPLDWKEPPSEKVIVPVPPVAVTVIVPFDEPLHVTLVKVVLGTTAAG